MKHKVLIICLIGFVVRAVFSLFIADLYFGRENIHVEADTITWMNSFTNLIENGVYTANAAHEYGYFLKMPGYSYFIGIVYYITGSDLSIAYSVIGWLQILFDVLAIFIIYKIGLLVFNSKKTTVLLAVLYAFYPFIIVWNPVVCSESLSILLLLTGIYYLLRNSKYNWFLSGLFIGLSILFRPQIALIVPLVGLYLIYINQWKYKLFLKPFVQFFLAILIFYGCWPISNYVFHKKVVFTQDLRGAPNWNADVIAFMQYTYSVKTEWEPQFSNILHNKEVTYPENAYFSKEDSIKLERAIYLSKNCGSGFSHWQGYWKEPLQNDSCNQEIAQIFNELRENQIKNFPWNFYLYLPLQNLKKAVFKSELYNTDGIRKYASLLFYYRSFLILFGFAGAVLMLVHKRKEWIIFLLYPILLYLLLCFGTGVQFRNIEIRYFLHADIILLFPAVYFFSFLLQKTKYFINTKNS